MQAMIDELAKQAAESLGQVSSKETLASFWQEYLSKNGKIPALMKNLRTVAPEERPAMGKIINELKQKVQADYDAAAAKVKEAELAARNAAETVDITLPAKTRTVGGLHPLTLVTNQIIDVFSGMGFAVAAMRGSENNDPFRMENGKVVKASNHSGGTLGGMSDGSPLLIRAYVKPTPSIFRPQQTVNCSGENTELTIRGRHDPIIVPRAVVVMECMTAITVLDAMMMNMSAKLDSLVEFYR